MALLHVISIPFMYVFPDEPMCLIIVIEYLLFNVHDM